MQILSPMRFWTIYSRPDAKKTRPDKLLHKKINKVKQATAESHPRDKRGRENFFELPQAGAAGKYIVKANYPGENECVNKFHVNWVTDEIIRRLETCKTDDVIRFFQGVPGPDFVTKLRINPLTPAWCEKMNMTELGWLLKQYLKVCMPVLNDAQWQKIESDPLQSRTIIISHARAEERTSLTKIIDIISTCSAKQCEKGFAPYQVALTVSHFITGYYGPKVYYKPNSLKTVLNNTVSLTEKIFSSWEESSRH